MTAKAKTQRHKRLRSECGLYFAEPIPGESLNYKLFNLLGNVVVERTTFWSNYGTKGRIRFETGSGKISAFFSYPRYPRWFRRRWVLCFDLWIDDLAALAKSFGCEVLVAFKPDINCWCHLGIRATAEQLQKLDAELDRRKIEWNGPPRTPGQWDIECPSKTRWSDDAASKKQEAHP